MQQPSDPQPFALPRRGVLGLAGAAAFAAATTPALADEPATPAQAIDRLMAGNARFVARQMTSFDADLDLLRRGTAEGQAPYAAVLSCADSRVPVELVFDESIGKVFVVRVAGVLATTEIMASLEYGAAVLGTKAILVLAHQSCGAVKAAMAGKEVPGQISALYRPLQPAVKKGGGDLDAASKANARIQAGLVASASPVLAGMIKKGTLAVAPAYYELGTGRVTLL
jgi:carbonic anhydrase